MVVILSEPNILTDTGLDRLGLRSVSKLWNFSHHLRESCEEKIKVDEESFWPRECV